MPHRAATLFCMPLIAAGLAWSPLRLWRAFRRGCCARNPHGPGPSAALLALPLVDARAALARDRGLWASRARFALLLQAGAITVTP
jgi:hypothetical protein